MKDDGDLRARFGAMTRGNLPAGFIDEVVRALPEPRTGRSAAWLLSVGAAVVVGAIVVTVAVLRPLGELPASSTRPGSALPSADVSASADPVGQIRLSIEMTPGGCCPPSGTPNSLVFSLQGNVARYHDHDWGISASEERIAYLTDDQVASLIAFAIGPGGIGQAEVSYPRASFGPSGETVITVVSPQLTKTITYGLAPGNLARDEDPTLGGLPRLVDRLGSFSMDVRAGNAVGGMASRDAERAERIALSDPRFSTMLDDTAHSVEAIIPDPGDASGTQALVYLAVDGSADWPAIDACEIGAAEGSATGVVWLVDVAEERILAVSPRWGDADCLGSIWVSSP